MDPTDAPSAKRKRTKSPASPVLSLNRASDLWFDDGSIILKVETTQFRVHRTVLSTNSDIFRDMLSVPQPVGEEVIEGCPVVRLRDSAKDWTYVLRALYDSRKCYLDSGPLSITTVAAFLKLGTKYNIAQLRSEAVERLSYEYPSSLEVYDELCLDRWKKITFENGINFNVANLAREVGLTSILPAVLYSICASRNFVEEILDGAPGKDGRRVTLSFDYQRLCILARERLLELRQNQTFKWLSTVGEYEDCNDPETCAIEGMRLFRRVFRSKPLCMALESWGIMYYYYQAEFCDPCIAEFKKMHNAGRISVWNELPSIFGLPGWEELLME